MAKYYVNNKAQAISGDHEVHKSGCDKMPSDTKDLGEHSSCHSAVKEAKKTYEKADGCYYCSNECHKS